MSIVVVAAELVAVGLAICKMSTRAIKGVEVVGGLLGLMVGGEGAWVGVS